MLRWIRVRDIAVIDRLEMEFEPGLNLLTGETGAGKSVLVDALGLVLGARASADLVRTGAATGWVEAGFELDGPPEPLRRRLDEAGIALEPGEELVVRREIAASGRSKIAVGGCGGTAALLRAIAPFLGDIHGQGESLSLLRPEAGLELLDRMGESTALRAEVAAAFRGLREVEASMAALRQQAAERAAREDLLRFQLEEIEAAALRPGEDEELAAERERLVHGERLHAAAEHAYGELYEEEGSILDRLATVARRVAELAAVDERLGEYAERAAAIRSELEDLALFLRDYREQVRFSPARLDAVEARLVELDRLKKKYGGRIEQVLAHAERCRDELEGLEHSTERLAALEAERGELEARFRRAARTLSSRRRRAAAELEKRVMTELRSLALEKARFVVALEAAAEDEPEGWSETGIDRVELLFSANPGEELRPLARVASGGELARFLLALKAVGAKGEPSRTLVFDEVDAGIGGRVADAVGEKLKELSRVHQVICVTHLPQVASFADAHYRIVKEQRAGRTVTRVERLDERGRVDEIARMLAGAVVTETARRHARQLVAEKR